MNEKLLAFIKSELGGIETWEQECPGVYYVAVQPSDSLFADEYYIVTPEADMISKKARQYGQIIDSSPALRLYRLEDPEKGRYILDYEINRYRVKNGLPLPPQTSLHNLALYAMEHNPEYFGEYPVPVSTPWGYTTLHRRMANGVYWLETDLCRKALAVCYPYSNEFSGITMKTARYTADDWERGIDETMGYAFFAEADICLAVFELMALRPEWRALVDEAALMNAIWRHHPEYAVDYNIQEQAGLHDYLGRLLKIFDIEVKLKGSAENPITYCPDIGEDFLLFLKEYQ